MTRHRWTLIALHSEMGGNPASSGKRCDRCGLVRENSRTAYSTTKTARYWRDGKLVACARGAAAAFTVPRGCPPCVSPTPTPR